MGQEDLKRYDLETKENFALYLKELIILTHRNIMIYKRYIKELRRIVEESDYQNCPNEKINPYLYIDMNNKISAVDDDLLNLIGDETKMAMSYKKFRSLAKKRMEKGLDLCLSDLSDEIKMILNKINELRNWCHHIPESMFTARLELTTKLIEDGEAEMVSNPIIISDFSYYEAAWMTSLLMSHENSYDEFSKVFQQMKKDYSILIGQSMRIEYRIDEVRLIEDLSIPDISLKIQQRKYKGIVD